VEHLRKRDKGLIATLFLSGGRIEEVVRLRKRNFNFEEGKEKVAIESVQATTTSFSVWAKSTGGNDVVITEVIIRDASGNQVGPALTPSGGAVTLPADGTLTEVPVTISLSASSRKIPQSSSIRNITFSKTVVCRKPQTKTRLEPSRTRNII